MILAKIKDKETILKAAREKETVVLMSGDSCTLLVYKGVPIRLPADFSKETLREKRG